MEITPFTIDVPDADVRDLKARLANTRWPSDVVSDWSRGTPASYARGLADRWANDFDWAAQQDRLNAYPQFTTTIDGQLYHFVHVRSAVPDATPLLIAHGYPSSFVEFTRMIGPLVDPEAHGGRPEDAFHVVIPSLPGFGFSTPATRPGLGIKGAAAAFDQIMQGLGYERYGVHGGDVGAGIAEELSILAGDRIIGSLVVTDPGAIATEYTPPTDHLTPEEQERLQALKAARVEDFGYLALQTTRPQSIAYGLTDSPVMQLTWIVEKVREWTDPAQGAARGRGRHRPSPHARQRVLVRRGRRRRGELPVRGDARRGVVGPDPRPAAGLRVVRRGAVGPPGPRPEPRARVLERARRGRPLPRHGAAGPARRRPAGVLRDVPLNSVPGMICGPPTP